MYLSVVFLCVLLSAGWCIEISEHVQQYCSTLLEMYDSDPSCIGLQNIIEPGICPNVETFNTEDYFLPKVLIWCPVTKFKTQLKCPQHGILLKSGPWKLSQKVNADPRLLSDLNGNVLLLSRYYVCTESGNYHRILSSDVRLFDQLPEFVEIPFIISHRSCCTVRYITFLLVQIGHGVSFSEIADIMSQLNFEDYCRRKRHLLIMCAKNNLQPSQKYVNDTAFNQDQVFTCASESYLRDIFLRYFRGAKCQYDTDMSLLTASSISMDHTFKICRNVGAVRPVDGKWVTQYGSLFAVMNEQGEIIKWSLCSGEGFDEIRSGLCELRDRLNKQGNHLTHAMVDICCKWRGKLHEVFGNGLLVKLDLFHAVQRVSSKIKQRSKYRNDCVNDLSLIFRCPGDMGKVRLQPTPPPDVMLMQYDHFLQKWSNSIESDILSSEVLKELKNLKQHIIKGCLSDIPVGHGTQRNEGLHSLINRSLICGATRIGVELACALLAVLFHLTNTKIRRKQLRCRVPMLMGELLRRDSSSNGTRTTENFGLFPNNEFAPHFHSLNSLEVSCPEVESNIDGKTDLSRVDDVNHLLQEQVLIPMALNLHELLSNVSKDCSLKSTNPWEYPCYSSEDIMCILSNRFEPVVCEEERVHDLRLTSRLNAFNRVLEPVEKDGNCAFTALACQVSRLYDFQPSQEFVAHLLSIGINSSQSVERIAQNLRQLYVDELISNPGEYFPQTFNMSESEYKDAALAYVKDGVYSNQLGDFVMKGMSKVLGCAVIIITSMTSCEVIPFIPQKIICKDALYVAYNQFGSGHYDSTLKQITPMDTLNYVEPKQSALGISSARKIKCRCGRDKIKNDPNYVSCTNKTGKYATRCPCHKSIAGCCSECRCANCANEYGKRTYNVTVQSSGTGIRNRYILASNKRKSSEEYLKNAHQIIKPGTWSDLETAFLEAILQFINSTAVLSSPENVLTIFNHLATSQSVSQMGLTIRLKSLDQVKGKLKFRQQRAMLSKLFTAQQLRLKMSDVQRGSSE